MYVLSNGEFCDEILARHVVKACNNGGSAELLVYLDFKLAVVICTLKFTFYRKSALFFKLSRVADGDL